MKSESIIKTPVNNISIIQLAIDVISIKRSFFVLWTLNKNDKKYDGIILNQIKSNLLNERMLEKKLKSILQFAENMQYEWRTIKQALHMYIIHETNILR